LNSTILNPRYECLAKIPRLVVILNVGRHSSRRKGPKTKRRFE